MTFTFSAASLAAHCKTKAAAFTAAQAEDAAFFTFVANAIVATGRAYVEVTLDDIETLELWTTPVLIQEAS